MVRSLRVRTRFEVDRQVVVLALEPEPERRAQALRAALLLGGDDARRRPDACCGRNTQEQFDGRHAVGGDHQAVGRQRDAVRRDPRPRPPPRGSGRGSLATRRGSGRLRVVVPRIGLLWGHGKLPRLSEVGATSVVAIARAASTRPTPASKPPAPGAGIGRLREDGLEALAVPPGVGLLEDRREARDLGRRHRRARNRGGTARPRAAPIPVPAARPATMSTPGAMTSGFRAPSPMRGPRLENHAVVSLASTAPTVSAASAAPGEVIVPGPSPELPAATMNRVSHVADSSSIAWLNGSVPSLDVAAQARGSRRRRRRSTAHLDAGQHRGVLAEARVVEHLADQQLARPARHPRGPAARAPRPCQRASVATCVPWPLPSTTDSFVLKFAVRATWPWRSGCVGS